MTQQVFQESATSYCLLDNVSIFLDRRNDKYHYLDRGKTRILDTLQSGLSPDETTSGHAPVNAEFLQELTDKHLLTTQVEGAKRLAPVSHQGAKSSVYDDYWKMRLYPATIAYLAFQQFSLLQRMNKENLYEMTQKAETLKAGLIGRERTISHDEMQAKAKRIIDSRYYVYTYRDKCLFDSCLFFTYFIKQRIPVSWVFGVNLYPFAAHCWVEYEGLVLNDPLERVAGFTPIYVI